MGKYFGTDGFRGEANVNLTAEHAYKIGRFLGWYYGEYSCAITPQVRQAGNRLSGLTETAYASLLA